MAFCTQCGASIESAAAVCARCGAPHAASGVPPAPPPAAGWAPPASGSPPPPAQGWAPPPQGWGQPAGWQSPSGAYSLGSNAQPGVQEKVSQAFDQIVRDIRSFDFKWVVPVDTALSPDFIRNRSVWGMLVFGFLPLAALILQVVTTAMGFLHLLEIYFGLAWACYYYYFVARRSVDLKIGLGVMAFTALIGVNLVLMVQTLPVLSWLYQGLGEGGDAMRSLLGFVLGVGPNEELFKALPVILVAFSMRRVEKPIDGIFYGAMSGLGFAISEGVGYVAKADLPLWQMLVRGTSLPFLHSLWSAIAGYFIALAVINRSRAPALVVTGLMVSAVLHGVYDWTSGGLLGLLMCAFTYLLFVSYMERSQAMVAEMQLAEQHAVEQSRLQMMWQQQYGGYAMPSYLASPAAPTGQGAPPVPGPGA